MSLVALTTPALGLAATCRVTDASLQGTYEGDCVAGLASGKGRAVGKGKYEGGFLEGRMTGAGIYRFADGRRVEGDFLDDKLNGKARFFYPNGDVLEGDFRANRLVGVGRMTRSNGTRVEMVDRDGKVSPLNAVAPSSSEKAGIAPAPATPGSNPSSIPPPAAASASSSASNFQWKEVVDLEDIFPSLVLATATRKSSKTPPRNYMGDIDGQVGVLFRAATPGMRVTLTIAIDEIAESTTQEFVLPAAGDYRLYPKIRYRFDKLRTWSQPTPATLTWSVSVDGAAPQVKSQPVRIRSVNDSLIASRVGNRTVDYSWLFAAYVNEDNPFIDQLLLETKKSGRVREFVGYQQGPAVVSKQVEAIYEMLKRRGITYSSITTTSSESDRVFSQHVRFVSDSVRYSQANCIDGTVLVASVLRKIGLEPVILLGPGHAMLGYLTESGNRNSLMVVETTMIGTGSFSQALMAGGGTWQKWAPLQNRDPRVQVISIADARRAGVMPIAR